MTRIRLLNVILDTIVWEARIPDVKWSPALDRLSVFDRRAPVSCGHAVLVLRVRGLQIVSLLNASPARKHSEKSVQSKHPYVRFHVNARKYAELWISTITSSAGRNFFLEVSADQPCAHAHLLLYVAFCMRCVLWKRLNLRRVDENERTYIMETSNFPISITSRNSSVLYVWLVLDTQITYVYTATTLQR